LNHAREPDSHYDAVVCRHLVWTLTDPKAALGDWFRVLKPGGHLLVFDGDFSAPGGLSGRVAKRLIAWLDRIGVAPPHNPLADRHAAIMGELPFADGLTFAKLRPVAEAAGFATVVRHSHKASARGQRQGASLREHLQSRLYHRFILHGRKPG
jgi:SAM-dependent methyltransferase